MRKYGIGSHKGKKDTKDEYRDDVGTDKDRMIGLCLEVLLACIGAITITYRVFQLDAYPISLPQLWHRPPIPHRL